MYLHIGNNKNIEKKDIVGIFNMDDTTVSQITKEFFKKAERKGALQLVAEELPKSFLLVQKKKSVLKNKEAMRVYLSQLSSVTLMQRAASKMK